MLEAQGFVVLDGGLATALEARGHDLTGSLWSARILLDAPEEIEAVHLDYLQAGADCIITASYQASLPGLRAFGLDEGEAEALLRRSTELAVAARERWASGQRGASSNRAGGGSDPAGRARRPTPLVAASVGPYGAFLADGSEYDGRYAVEDDELDAFHRRRLEILASSGADLLACETLPSAREAYILLSLLDELPGVRAWMSFSCRDGGHLWDGTPFVDVVRRCAEHPAVAAVGLNCTAPHHVGALVRAARTMTDRPLLAYPNSGERWDAAGGCWTPAEEPGRSWLDGVRDAWEAGARILGGCCRTGPADIGELRRGLERGDWSP